MAYKNPLLVFVILLIGGAVYAAPTPQMAGFNADQLLWWLAAPNIVVVSPLGTTGATPVAAFGDAEDVAVQYRKASVFQRVVITNLSESYICAKKVVGATANCAAQTITCNVAGANNGQPIPPLSQRALVHMTGLDKLCVLGAADEVGLAFIAERTLSIE